MYRGGYQIIDLKDEMLTSGTPSTVTGAYARITNNNRKAFLLCGCTVKDEANGTATALNDEYVNFIESGGGYTASLSNGGTLFIASSDAVTYTTAV